MSAEKCRPGGRHQSEYPAGDLKQVTRGRLTLFAASKNKGSTGTGARESQGFGLKFPPTGLYYCHSYYTSWK